MLQKPQNKITLKMLQNKLVSAAKPCLHPKKALFALQRSLIYTPNKRCLYYKEALFAPQTTENRRQNYFFPTKRQQIYPPKTPGMQIFVVKYFYQKALQFNISRHALCAIGEAAYNSNANHLANKKAAALSCAAAFYA